MKKVLKSLFLGTLLIATAFYALYYTYRDDIHSRLLVELNSRLNAESPFPVEIDEFSGIGIQGIAFSRISVFPNGKDAGTPVRIKDLRAAVDLFSLIKRKKLEITLYADGCSYGSYSGSLEMILSFKRVSDLTRIGGLRTLE
ncbi:MAG: hypothetical protein GF408_06010, partial [Candidatus Omnitrophica bacterium]|nr:hypothetical protein [Candidatus Omnitrophota bacterium]